MTRDELVAVAIRIAADTRLIDLWPHALGTGMCASDLQRDLIALADSLPPVASPTPTVEAPTFDASPASGVGEPNTNNNTTTNPQENQP